MNPKLKDDAVPVFLPGCPSYYSQTATKRSRLSFDSKEDELFSQGLSLSLKSDAEETQKFKINSFQDMQDKLAFPSLPKTWSLWYPDEYSLILMRPSLNNSCVEIDFYLVIKFDLSVQAFCNGAIS